MATKLLTLKELSDYLKVSEQAVLELVDDNVVIAYKIGGELLRFRKEQIDATRTEIDSRLREARAEPVVRAQAEVKTKERMRDLSGGSKKSSVNDNLQDFIYFNDFYMISGLLVIILLALIFRG